MKNIELLAVSIFFLMSCTNDLYFDHPFDKGEDEGEELEVSVQVGGNTRSVISGTTFPVSSSIGLFVTDANSTFTPFIGTYTYNSNLKWGSTGKKIYVTGKDVTAYAYYPSTATVVGTNTLSANSSFNATIFPTTGIEKSFNAQGQTDYMTTTPVEGVNSKNPVQLAFKHVLSKINFVINLSSSYWDSNYGKINTIRLSGRTSIFPINGTFNISTGNFTPRSKKGTIGFDPATTTYANYPASTEVTAFGLVAPSTSLSNVTLKIKIDGSTKTVTNFPKAPKWEAGKVYTYTITIQ